MSTQTTENSLHRRIKKTIARSFAHCSLAWARWQNANAKAKNLLFVSKQNQLPKNMSIHIFLRLSEIVLLPWYLSLPTCFCSAHYSVLCWCSDVYTTKWTRSPLTICYSEKAKAETNKKKLLYVHRMRNNGFSYIVSFAFCRLIARDIQVGTTVRQQWAPPLPLHHYLYNND